MNPTTYANDDQSMFDSRESLLVEATLLPSPPRPRTVAEWLSLMRMMVREHGYPLPPKFIRPPGIDFDALLKQVPWPPSPERDPAQDE